MKRFVLFLALVLASSFSIVKAQDVIGDDIPTGTTNLVLPSYLFGEFEIQIIQGNIYFWGYIEL